MNVFEVWVELFREEWLRGLWCVRHKGRFERVVWCRHLISPSVQAVVCMEPCCVRPATKAPFKGD